MTFQLTRAWFFILFTVSGFAGLIYESIWSHYIKLFLGHAAYAQTLVLAIFMGGLALGSWLCSRFSGNWRNLLTGYAAAEAAIGVCALVFHRVFVSVTDFSYDSVMPALGSPLAVTTFKWAVSAALILPQSVLLGMTFPLMSAGLIRAYPDHTGGTIAMLYFTNSLGAAAGVLASGFVLIGLVGLPGTMLTAGILNIVLALVVWLLTRDMVFAPPSRPEGKRRATEPPGYALMLAIAALTGAASFIYEIGWIRMLSLVLGSSTHAFELMLSAFILGLAFGGLWVRRRMDRADGPERFLGMVQVVMGLLALATLVIYGQTFELMQWLLGMAARTEAGYAAFNFGSHLIALLVMFPAAFCAGMTLPLITYALLRRGAGERAIGAVYAANTAGAIAGVFMAVHFGLPVLGLKGLITLGACIDIALGLVLLWRPGGGVWTPRVATAIGAAAVVATLAWVELDPYKMASGVYSHGQLLARESTQIVYHRDGKTATVDLVRIGPGLHLRTNGKTDASMNVEPGSNQPLDELTQVLLGALPLALHPEARSAANIGFGSGATSHVLLASDRIESVDTVEIEPAIVEASKGFRPYNESVYSDSRSRIHIEDARIFFSSNNRRYDIIVSEPSNPWVNGVASLFTDEFYRRLKRHLNDKGVFVQWLQLYEISPALVASVFKALARNFSDYAVYASYDLDLVIVARNGDPLPPPSDAVFAQPRLARELARVHIKNGADLDLHYVGARKVLQPYFDGFAAPANSDFFPLLDLQAARSRFMKEDTNIVNLTLAPVPALDLLGGGRRRGDISPAPRPWLQKAELTREALAARAYLLTGGTEHLMQLPEGRRGNLELVRLLALECLHPRRTVSLEQMFTVAGAMVPFLTSDESRTVWNRISSSPCFGRLDETQRNWVALFSAASARDAGEMARLAEGLLRRGGGERDAVRRDYLFAAAVVGRLARGEHDQALALWREFAAATINNRPQILRELLQGHLLSGSAGRGILSSGTGREK